MKNIILKAAVAVCLVLCLVKLSEFVYSRIPPFSVGECHAIKGLKDLAPFLYVKIEANHVLEGYSVVQMVSMGQGQLMAASFSDLREHLSDQVDCL